MTMNDLYLRYYAEYEAQKEYSMSLNLQIEKAKTEAENLREKAKRKDEKAEMLRHKLNQIPHVDWKDAIVGRLAEEVRRLLKKKNCHVAGPMGVGAKVTIYLFDGPSFEIAANRKEEYLSLTLEPDFDDNGNLVLRFETGGICSRYQAGSLGAESGLNRLTAPLPDDMEEIAKLFHPIAPLS